MTSEVYVKKVRRLMPVLFTILEGGPSKRRHMLRKHLMKHDQAVHQSVCLSACLLVCSSAHPLLCSSARSLVCSSAHLLVCSSASLSCSFFIKTRSAGISFVHAVDKVIRDIEWYNLTSVEGRPSLFICRKMSTSNM